MELDQSVNLSDDSKQKIDAAVRAAIEVFKTQAGAYIPSKKVYRMKGTMDKTLPVCQFGVNTQVINLDTGEQDEIPVLVAVGVGAGARFVMEAIRCAFLADALIAKAEQETQDGDLLRQAERNKA